MATKYLRSGAAGAGTGADWTNAYTTLSTAIAALSAGDTLYVADDHSESTAGIVTLSAPATSAGAASPVRILCVNTHTVTPPTALATSAVVANTGNVALNFTGFAYCYGITFQNGSGSSSNLARFSVGGSASKFGWVFETCAFQQLSTGASQMIIGNSSGDSFCELRNTTVQFGATTHTIVPQAARFYWRNTSSAISGSGSIPATLFTPSTAAAGFCEFSGVDFSALGSGKNLFSASVAIAYTAYLRNCKLGASVSIITGTIAGEGGVNVYLENCDSGNTNTRMEHYKFAGSIVQETTKVKTGGATDGTTPIAHKFVSLSSGPSLFMPLEGPWMTAWNESTSSLTATVEFLHDSATNLKNSDIYLEVEYLGTSSFPQSVLVNSRVADVFATAADCAAGVGTGSWTTTGMSNPNSQKLTATFTPASKGPIRWRVCLIKSNYTVYVDPQASGLANVSRAYLVPGAVYLNETGSSGGVSVLAGDGGLAG